MIKSASLSFSSASQRQRKAADQQRRHRIANQPTPDEMLEWLKGVKSGHVLVLVNKTGLPQDAYVDDVGRDFMDALCADRPAGARSFRRLMERMLSGLVNVPQDACQAAQALSELLADKHVKACGVVRTETLLNRLTELNNALVRDRQAQQDRDGVDLLEQSHSARKSPSSSDDPDATPTAEVPAQSGAARHEVPDLAPDVVTDLVTAGIGRRPLPARTTRTTVSLRFLPITPTAKPKDDASE